MSDWQALEAELDLWRREGRAPDFWWRDDDAEDDSASLGQLLGVATKHDIPLALAVVPAGATEALAQTVAGAHGRVTVLQHGYAHRNHAGAGEKKIELGAQQPAQIVIGELATGLDRLGRQFGGSLLPVLVPPWNRIAPHLLPLLPELGYRGLSQFGVRKKEIAVRGVRQINCHIDLIDWRGQRGFVGEAAALGQVIGHLRLRRGAWSVQPAVAGEPTGLMTHHRAHDAASWQFLDRLLGALAPAYGARWFTARQAFAP